MSQVAVTPTQDVGSFRHASVCSMHGGGAWVESLNYRIPYLCIAKHAFSGYTIGRCMIIIFPREVNQGRLTIIMTLHGAYV